MKRGEALTLPLSDPYRERGIRWFSAVGSVMHVGDERQVWIGGTLIATFDREDVVTRNTVVVLLSEGPTMHLGQLADAFELSSERIRQLRRSYESEGHDGITRINRTGRPPAYSARDRKKLEAMFAKGATVPAALARIGKGNRTSVANLRADWRRRVAQSAAPSVEVATAQPTLPLALVAPAPAPCDAESIAAAPTPDVAAPALEVAARAGDEVRRGDVGGSPERADSVQHLGTWLLIALTARLGVHAAAEEIAGSGSMREALRVALDAVIAALAIGEHTVEGVRRLQTPSAPKLLRTQECPPPPSVRAVLSEFAEAHDGLAPIQFQHAMLAKYIAQDQATRDDVAVFYIDNHLRPYSGGEVVRHGWRMQDKRAVPGISDYYAHDEDGRPLMRVACPSHDSLGQWLAPIGELLRGLLDEGEAALLAFDRAGAFPQTLAGLRNAGFQLVTYERRPYTELPASAFTESVTMDGEVLRYTESRTNLGRGRGRVRRITVRGEDGRQINLLAVSTLPAARLIEIMRGRWLQENGFKHGVERWGINQLDERKTVDVDPDEIIPNPARRRLDRALRAAYDREGDARRKLAALSAEAPQRARWEEEIRVAQDDQATFLAQRPSTPSKARVADTELAGVLVRHEGRRKQVLDTVRIACANAESEIAARIAVHLARPREAKMIVANIFKAPGSVRVHKTRIDVELAVAANPAERPALERLFADLDQLRLTLPGDRRPLRFRSQN